MQRINSWGPSLVLLVMGLLFLASPRICQAQGNPVQHSSGAFSVTLYDDATGEFIDIDVTVKSDFHVVVDSGGNFHLNAHDVYSGRGTGETSGVTYLGNQTDDFGLTFTAGGGTETSSVHFSLISKGGTDNLELTALFHLTVNANGVITALVDNFSVASRGK